MLKALIFDVDGTLAETEEVHRQAFNDTFEAHGLAWLWDQKLYARLLQVAGGKERMRHFIDVYKPPLPRGDLDDDAIKTIHLHKTARYMDLINSGEVVLRPGIRKLLIAAKRYGLKIAISTTTSLPNVEALLAATLGKKAINDFDAIGAGDVVPRKKPAPDIYFKVLDDLGLDAKDCLAFEDSANGLKSALGAGIPTVVTKSIYTSG